MGQTLLKHEIPGLLDLQPSLLPHLLFGEDTFEDAMEALDNRPDGFVIITDNLGRLNSLLDRTRFHQHLKLFRRLETPLSRIREKQAPHTISVSATQEEVAHYFTRTTGNLLPVLDMHQRVVNCITRAGFHLWMCRDPEWDPMADFLNLHHDLPDPVRRPWGFFRSLLDTGFCHSKILSLETGQELSLQKHQLREEHWTIVKGTGLLRLENDLLPVKTGDNVFIPRHAVHWLKNTGTESLMLVEVQLGDAFEESDIIRLADRYCRM